MIKIGIVGSRKYTNKERIINTLKLCMEKYGNQLTVVSGGAKGADSLGKEAALELNLNYIEYNPGHEQWNQYSGKPKDWYGKEYNVSNYFERNTFIAEDSDLLFAFIPEGHISNGTQDTIKKAKALNKFVYIIN
jgi:predicted Rossmann-fold nucleotide-binding protein